MGRVKAGAPVKATLDRPVAERVLESVRGDIRSMVEGGSYTENPDRFARLAEAQAELCAALGVKK